MMAHLKWKWAGTLLTCLVVGCAGYSVRYEPSSPVSHANSSRPLSAVAGIVRTDPNIANEFKNQLEAARVFRAVKHPLDPADRVDVTLEIQLSVGEGVQMWDPTAEGAEVIFTYGLAVPFITHVTRYESNGMLIVRAGDSWTRSYASAVRAESHAKMWADSRAGQIAAAATQGLQRQVCAQLIGQLLRDRDALAAELKVIQSAASRSAPSALAHR